MSPASRAHPQGAGAIVSPLTWAIAGICASGARQRAVRTRTLAQTTLAASADTGLRVLASSALRVATGPRLMASFQIFETHAHIHVAFGSTATRHAHTHRRLRLCRCRGQDCDEGKSHDHTHCAQHFMNLRSQRDQGSLRERRASCKREIRAPALRRGRFGQSSRASERRRSNALPRFDLGDEDAASLAWTADRLQHFCAFGRKDSSNEGAAGLAFALKEPCDRLKGAAAP
jgi:hypothetical protein